MTKTSLARKLKFGDIFVPGIQPHIPGQAPIIKYRVIKTSTGRGKTTVTVSAVMVLSLKPDSEVEIDD